LAGKKARSLCAVLVEWFAERGPKASYGETIPAHRCGTRLQSFKAAHSAFVGAIHALEFPHGMLTRKGRPPHSPLGCAFIVKKGPPRGTHAPVCARAWRGWPTAQACPKGLLVDSCPPSEGGRHRPGLRCAENHNPLRKIHLHRLGPRLGSHPACAKPRPSEKMARWNLGWATRLIVFDDGPILDAAVAGPIICKFRQLQAQTCVLRRPNRILRPIRVLLTAFRRENSPSQCPH